MDPMLERRRRMILAGQDPGPMPPMMPGMPPPGTPPPMGMPMPPNGAPPAGPGMPPPMPPPMGAPPMPMPPFPQGAAPPVPQPQGGPPPMPPPPGGAPPMGPGIASYAAQPAQPAHPAWFPGPPVPKPRPPPRRQTAVEELGERMGQPPAPPVAAHEPEAGRVPQPVGDASGYDPTAVYGGARGSTREMPRDDSFGHSAGLMDWLASRMGWR